MIRLDAATVLLQWATGGLLFLWVTTRRREVGIGYGWLVRGVYLLMAAAALFVGLRFGRSGPRPRSRVGWRGGDDRAGSGGVLPPSQGRRGGGAAACGASQRPRRRHDRHRPSPGRLGPVGARVPSRAGPAGADHRVRRTRCGWHRRRRSRAPLSRPDARRCGLPRFDQRRHAAGSLVPRAARPSEGSAARSGALARAVVAAGGPGAAVADGDGGGVQRRGGRRLQRHARLVLGRLRGDHDRACGSDPRGAT